MCLAGGAAHEAGCRAHVMEALTLVYARGETCKSDTAEHLGVKQLRQGGPCFITAMFSSRGCVAPGGANKHVLALMHRLHQHTKAPVQGKATPSSAHIEPTVRQHTDVGGCNVTQVQSGSPRHTHDVHVVGMECTQTQYCALAP